jgi:hypothetical protein
VLEQVSLRPLPVEQTHRDSVTRDDLAAAKRPVDCRVSLMIDRPSTGKSPLAKRRVPEPQSPVSAQRRVRGTHGRTDLVFRACQRSARPASARTTTSRRRHTAEASVTAHASAGSRIATATGRPTVAGLPSAPTRTAPFWTSRAPSRTRRSCSRPCRGGARMVPSREVPRIPIEDDHADEVAEEEQVRMRQAPVRRHAPSQQHDDERNPPRPFPPGALNHDRSAARGARPGAELISEKRLLAGAIRTRHRHPHVPGGANPRASPVIRCPPRARAPSRC